MQQAFASDEERLQAFANALDALRQEVEAKLGAEDIAHIEKVRKVSRAAEVLGRTLVHFSLDPLTFSLGVGSLWVHKTLELMEVGHTALHSAYDKLPGGEAYRARDFRWKAPIDEQGWMLVHNVRHHQYTNIAGRDPDLDFGGLRLSERIPYKRLHRLQPASNVASWLGFASAINLHVTGMLDVYLGKSNPPVLPDHSWPNIKKAHVAFLKKAVPYYLKEQVLFPLLAGPFFWKVSLGNALSDVARDVWAGAIIYCGHVGAEEFPQDAKASSRAHWYAMQVEAAVDVEVSPWVSVMCGGLDKQIEHHLFQRLPPNRLREIAPRVRAICEQHGVKYRSGSWPRRLKAVMRRLWQLSGPSNGEGASSPLPSPLHMVTA